MASELTPRQQKRRATQARGSALLVFREALGAALGAGVPREELMREVQQTSAGHFTEAQLRARWRAPADFLPRLRANGEGPGYIKVGSRHLYPYESVRAFERQRDRGDAPQFLAECRHHGLTFFRQVKSGTTPQGLPKYTRRCLKCQRAADARRRNRV